MIDGELIEISIGVSPSIIPGEDVKIKSGVIKRRVCYEFLSSFINTQIQLDVDSLLP